MKVNRNSMHMSHYDAKSKIVSKMYKYKKFNFGIETKVQKTITFLPVKSQMSHNSGAATLQLQLL